MYCVYIASSDVCETCMAVTLVLQGVIKCIMLLSVLAKGSVSSSCSVLAWHTKELILVHFDPHIGGSSPYWNGISVSVVHYPLLVQQKHDITLTALYHKVNGYLMPTASQLVSLQLVTSLVHHAKTRQCV